MLVSSSLGECPHANSGVVLLLSSDGLLDLLKLELHQLILLVTVGVVLGQDSECPFLLTFADQPSRRLLGEPKTDELDDTRDDLDKTAEPP